MSAVLSVCSNSESLTENLFGSEGNLQNASIASIINVSRCASVTISDSVVSPSVGRCGFTNLLKKESIVPIGASSNNIISCSLSASDLSLGSAES